jgi:ABC-type dipeptide/oligopeptide/nickel transport system permease subunit
VFLGAGLIVIAMLVLPVFGGIAAGIFFLSVPRFRYLAAYALLTPFLGVSGLVAGFFGGLRLARPYFYRYEYGLSTTEWPAWALTGAGMFVGVALGLAVAVVVSFRVNRVVHYLAPKRVL